MKTSFYKLRIVLSLRPHPRSRRRALRRRRPPPARAPTRQRLLDVNAIRWQDEVRRRVRLRPRARDGLFLFLFCLCLAPHRTLYRARKGARKGALQKRALRNGWHRLGGFVRAAAAPVVRVVQDGAGCGANDDWDSNTMVSDEEERTTRKEIRTRATALRFHRFG
jgi:hypothetical protein